jgi:hypothetical protein
MWGALSDERAGLSFTVYSIFTFYMLLHEFIRRGADKSLAVSISYFTICSTTKRIFLGWVKEVRKTKS